MSKRKLLVVSEERLLGDLLKSALGEHLEVRAAASTAEAERHIQKSKPDLALVDLSIEGSLRLLEMRDSSAMVAIVDSPETRQLAQRAGLDAVDRKDGLADLIYLLQKRLDLDSLRVSGSERSVLVVEDEEPVRWALTEGLRQLGYNVEVA